MILTIQQGKLSREKSLCKIQLELNSIHYITNFKILLEG